MKILFIGEREREKIAIKNIRDNSRDGKKGV